MGRALSLGLALALSACGGAAPGGASEGASSTGGGPSTGTPVTTGSPPVPGDSTSASGSDGLGGTSSSSGAPEPTTGSATTTTTTGEETSTTTGAAESSSSSGDAGSSTGEPPGEPLTLDHAQVKGTHNSYHLEPALPFDASHEYSHAPLAVQLGEQGVRAFELDVHEGLDGFEVYHITVIDPEATCDSLPGCLGEIHTWSEQHPQHLPIVVWIEIKDSTGGLPIDAADLDMLDDAIRAALPEGELFAPDDLQGAFPSVRAALEAEGWPTIESLRGRVLVVLLNVDDGHAEDYTAGYTSLSGRAMFARATPSQFALPWAAIAKLGIYDDADIAAAHAGRMLIATNVCSSGDDDGECEDRLAAAEAAGIHMLKDDFPAKVDDMQYFLDLPDGSPARCNPVTAPPTCTSAALEDL